MFAFQFAYLSSMPVGVFCPPFTSLGVWRYSFGWNGLLFQLSQTPIDSNYSALGIKSSFLSNINFMMLFLVVCPIISAIMSIAGKHSTHYKTKPKLLGYGKSFLLDIPFTILLFNAPNISSSFVVNIQAFGVSDVLSAAVGITMLGLLLAGAILLYFFRDSFR